MRASTGLLHFGFETRNPLVRALYDLYSSSLMPRLGRLASGHADAYLYLPASIRTWPDQEGFAQLMTQAGFEHVWYHEFMTGIAVLHVGTRGGVDS